MKTTKTNPEAPKKKTVSALLAHLDFSPENIVEVACRHAIHFADLIDLRKEQMGVLSEAKMELELAKAETDIKIRQDARAANEKVTEGFIEAQVVTNSAVIKAMRALASAERDDAYMKLAVESFRMARDCMEIVKDLVRNEFSLANAVESGAASMQKARAKWRARMKDGDEE